MTIDAADRFTIESAKVRTFSDILDNFDKNPKTGFLARVENEQSVKQAVRNLIMTERTERFYRSWVGSKIRSLLFDPVDRSTEDMLRLTIKETIDNNEPRVKLLQLDVDGNMDYDAYFVNIYFSILNIPQETFNLSLVLKRVR